MHCVDNGIDLMIALYLYNIIVRLGVMYNLLNKLYLKISIQWRYIDIDIDMTVSVCVKE